MKLTPITNQNFYWFCSSLPSSIRSFSKEYLSRYCARSLAVDIVSETLGTRSLKTCIMRKRATFHEANIPNLADSQYSASQLGARYLSWNALDWNVTRAAFKDAPNKLENPRYERERSISFALKGGGLW